MRIKLGKAAKTLISTLAPTIGTALGGPLGTAAGAVLADALGVPENEIDKAIANDPDAAAKVRQAELDFEVKMEELGVRREELLVMDRGNARDLAKATTILPQLGLSVVFIVGYFVALDYVLTDMANIDQDVKVLAAGLLGLFTREIPTIMQFWFGSSHGSKTKSALSGSGLGDGLGFPFGTR